jgi:hypothetical protein
MDTSLPESRGHGAGVLPTRRWIAWVALVLIPAAVVAIELRRSHRSTTGAATAEALNVTVTPGLASDGVLGETAERGALVVYAAPRHSDAGEKRDLRFVADLPGPKPGRVSMSESIAFGVRNLHSPAFVTIFGAQDDGTVHVYLPRPSGEPVSAAAGWRTTMLRPYIHVGGSHHAGRLVVRAVFSTTPLDLEATRKALAGGATLESIAAALDTSAFQVGGVLTVEP